MSSFICPFLSALSSQGETFTIQQVRRDVEFPCSDIFSVFLNFTISWLCCILESCFYMLNMSHVICNCMLNTDIDYVAGRICSSGRCTCTCIRLVSSWMVHSVSLSVCLSHFFITLMESVDFDTVYAESDSLVSTHGQHIMLWLKLWWPTDLQSNLVI